LSGVITDIPTVDQSFGLADGQYVSPEDTAILEDASGRISIRESPAFKVDE
jgi:hypothetical protein